MAGVSMYSFNHVLEYFQASRRWHTVACWYLYRQSSWKIAQVPTKTGFIVLAIHKNLAIVWLHLHAHKASQCTAACFLEQKIWEWWWLSFFGCWGSTGYVHHFGKMALYGLLFACCFSIVLTGTTITDQYRTCIQYKAVYYCHFFTSFLQFCMQLTLSLYR